MRRAVKRMLAALLLVTLLLCLSGCSYLYEHENEAVGAFDVGYSRLLRDAFLTNYMWDGTQEGLRIETPERYGSYSVTGLGGYCGRGVPSPFHIEPSESARERLCPEAARWYFISTTRNIDDYTLEYVQFSLHIGKNIKAAKNVWLGGLVYAECEGEVRDRVYMLTCYVTCDEENRFFYAEDGRLYERKTGALVEGIVYADVDLDELNEAYESPTDTWVPFA